MAETCIHCGADCGKSPVIWNEKPFCCNGCVQVYRLLNENKLYQYYNLEQTPGIKVDQTNFDNKYAYLDKPEVQEKLFEFHEDNIAKVSFFIPSIHCASCIWLLEHLNKLHSGVKYSSVHFTNKTVSVSFNSAEISLRQLVELLVSIHYIPDISLQTLDKKDSKKNDKTLLYKVGVAGFVFGNVMLYSLPEYFNGEPLNESLGTFLYWITYILTIPLVFYSGSDYLASAFKNLRKGIVNIDLPIAIGILTLFFVTSYEVISNSGPGYSDSLAGFLFFLLLGKWYQSKTYQALAFDRDYKSYFPVAVTKITSSGEESTLLEEIKVGDELLIRNKELIPADAELIEGVAFIDYSFVTGESTPVKKEPGDFVYAGGVQTGGSIHIKVKKEVKQSHLTKLWNQSENNAPRKKSLISIIDKISVYFTAVIIGIALLGFGVWMFLGSFHTAILVLTSVLIVACPCALALSLPFTFGNTMRILGTKGMYIKNTEVIEKLTKIDTIVFDKTGTLTKPDENNIFFEGKSLSEVEIQAIVSLAQQSIHPLSFALTKHFKHVQTMPCTGFVEVAGRGIFATVIDKKVKLGSQEYVCGIKTTDAKKASKVYVSIDNQERGHFTISNQYRDGFTQVIADMKRHFDLFLLSGDNDSEKETLSEYFDPGHLHFNRQPQDKMDFIQYLQQQNKNVLMTGDGLNDAGAFMQSDVALSIADDIYHFSPAGDAIIEAKKFYQLYRFIQFARKSLTIVKISFFISFLYNIIGLAFAITGNLSPVVAAILMPISSISVVAFATFSTRALAARYLK